MAAVDQFLVAIFAMNTYIPLHFPHIFHMYVLMYVVSVTPVSQVSILQWMLAKIGHKDIQLHYMRWQSLW